MGELELFDNAMQFRMPPASDVAKLPKEAQKRFEDVRRANDKLGNAIKHRERIQARIEANAQEAADNAAELASLRPAWTPINEARAFIRAEQDQRAKERGYR